MPPMSSQPAADMTPTPPDEGTPVSVKIRERLAAARKRFHANDNIADALLRTVLPGPVWGVSAIRYVDS